MTKSGITAQGGSARRQVDPLFTLDLSNPSEPKVLGELKIPGFSSYIHMMDENHLLTVGRDADLDGRVRGMKISIFDVTDMTQPKETANLVLDMPGYQWSEAQWNHKAFTFFRSRGLLAIPLTSYDYEQQQGFWWERYRSELIVVSASVTDGLKLTGTLPMNDINQTDQRDYDSWYRFAEVRRSIFADDYVYALSNYGIRAARVEALPEFDNTVTYQK